MTVLYKCDDEIYGITEIGNLMEVEKIVGKERKIYQSGNVFPFNCNAYAKGINNKIYAVKGYEQGSTPLF